MATIKSINPSHGDSVYFTGATVDEAVASLAAAITACGSGRPEDEWTTDPWNLAEGDDYVVVEP